MRRTDGKKRKTQEEQPTKKNSTFGTLLSGSMCVCFSQGGGSTYYVRGPTIHHRAIYRGNGGPNGSPRPKRGDSRTHHTRRARLSAPLTCNSHQSLSLLAASTLNSRRGTWTSNDSPTAKTDEHKHTFSFSAEGKFVVVVVVKLFRTLQSVTYWANEILLEFFTF